MVNTNGSLWTIGKTYRWRTDIAGSPIQHAGVTEEPGQESDDEDYASDLEEHGGKRVIGLIAQEVEKGTPFEWCQQSFKEELLPTDTMV